MKCANCDRELPADEHGTTHSDFGDCWRNTRHELLAARKVVKAARRVLNAALIWPPDPKVPMEDQRAITPLSFHTNGLPTALADYDALEKGPEGS